MRKILIIFAVVALYSTNAFSTIAHTWVGKPINVMLGVGQEKLVRVPDNAQFRFPQELAEIISVQSAAGVLYIKAFAPVQDIPLDIRLVESGTIIMMRLTAVDELQDDSDILVNLPLVDSKVKNKQSEQTINSSLKSFDPVEMIRFAATRNLMPQRLWPKSNSITAAPVPKDLKLEQLFYGASAGVFESTILETYRTGNMFLSVISLRNKTPFPSPIYFSDISIHFDFASVPEPYYGVGASGSVNDTSLLYLITKGELTPHVLLVDPSAVSKKDIEL